MKTDRSPLVDTAPGRPMIVLGVLLLMLTAVAVGCTVVSDLTTSTTLSDSSTTSTILPGTTSTARLTTTTAQPTTTTTTTAAESTTPTSTSGGTTTTTTVHVTSGEAQSSGTVLYEITDWSAGVSGWAAAGQWKTAGGMLVTDGTSDSFAVAPVDLTGHPDYVVECEIQFVDPKARTDAVLMARMINGNGYWGGFSGSKSRMVVGYGATESGGAGFVLDGGWHKYRLEVRGNTIKLFLEQAEVARAVDNRALDPGTVGIYCAHGQINVRSFRVIAL